MASSRANFAFTINFLRFLRSWLSVLLYGVALQVCVFIYIYIYIYTHIYIHTYIPHAITLSNFASCHTIHLHVSYNPQNGRDVFVHKSLVRLSGQIARRFFPEILNIIR